MRHFLSKMTLGILAVVLTAGIFLISVSFLMYGAAIGLETVFVANPWLGWIIIGGVFILGPLLFFTFYFSKTKMDEAQEMAILEWVRKYPYQATGAAAAVGFIVASKEMPDITHILKGALLPFLVEHLQSK